MRTKVTNCGKYDCMHNERGYCITKTVAIDKNGKCILANEKTHPCAGGIDTNRALMGGECHDDH